MKGLVINELQKIFKQKGYKVLLIIFLSLTLVIGSLYSFIILMATTDNGTAKSVKSDWEYEVRHNDDEYLKTYYTALAESCDFFIDNKIDDWKFKMRSINRPDEVAFDYETLYAKKALLEGLIDGSIDIDELLSKGYWEYENLLSSTFVYGDRIYLEIKYPYYYDYEKYEEYDEYGNPINDDSVSVKEEYSRAWQWFVLDEKTGEYTKKDSCPCTKVWYQKLLAETEDDIELYHNALEKADSDEYIKKYVDTHEKNIKDIESKIKISNDKTEIEELELRLEYERRFSDMYQFLIDETDTLDDPRFDYVGSLDDSMYRDEFYGFDDVMDMDFLFGNRLSVYSYTLVPMSEDEFERSGYEDIYELSYEEYSDKIIKSRETVHRALDIAEASVYENKLPEGIDAQTKNVFRTSIMTASSLITVLLIVISGIIVASEQSSGTMRLLLIRPKKRWKILTSKLLAVLILDVALHIVCSVLLLGTSLINGIGDVFRPDIDYVFGRLVIIPAIVNNLKIMLFSIISSLPVVAFAFMLSSVTFKTPLSIALTFVLNYVVSGVKTICTLIFLASSAFGGSGTPLLYKLTIFPYTNLTDFRMSEELSIVSNGGIFSELSAIMGGGVGGSDSLGLLYGIAIVLAHATLFIFLAYLSFNKKEIKN